MARSLPPTEAERRRVPNGARGGSQPPENARLTAERPPPNDRPPTALPSAHQRLLISVKPCAYTPPTDPPRGLRLMAAAFTRFARVAFSLGGCALVRALSVARQGSAAALRGGLASFRGLCRVVVLSAPCCASIHRSPFALCASLRAVSLGARVSLLPPPCSDRFISPMPHALLAATTLPHHRFSLRTALHLSAPTTRKKATKSA